MNSQASTEYTSFRSNPAPESVSRGTDAGDREAFERLFELHRDGLLGFLCRKLRNREEAEDAVSLTFCKAWRARGSFRGESSEKTWLYRIATRVALDMMRRRYRRPVEEELDARQPDLVRALEADPVEPISILLEEEWLGETQRAVNEAIRRLNPDQQRLLTLYYFDGRNYDEISAILGISYSKVRGRLHLIRERLRRDLLVRQRWHPSGWGPGEALAA